MVSILETMKDLLPDSCREGKHDFTEVYKHTDGRHTDIVQWCKDCGAIKVSIEHPMILVPHFKTRLISIFNQIALIKVK